MRPQRPRPAAGFTLLELLVVLTIVALSIGLVLPSASRWVDAARERGWRADLRATLAGLPVRAFRQGEALALDAPALRALQPELPADLNLRLPQPLRYTAMGVAEGGQLTLGIPGQPAETWTIEPVSGRVLP